MIIKQIADILIPELKYFIISFIFWQLCKINISNETHLIRKINLVKNVLSKISGRFIVISDFNSWLVIISIVEQLWQGAVILGNNRIYECETVPWYNGLWKSQI
jgi:hypothetical protein